MTITAAYFRTDFSEFGDTTLFPDSSINYWLQVAGLLLNTQRFGQPAASVSSPTPRNPNTVNDIATELFVAHNIALEARASQESANGGVPGAMTGPISSKAVDKVSVSYDTAAGLDPDGGHWNLTIYGVRFLELMKMFGMGPITVTGCGGGSAQAWPGPYPWPSPTGFSN